MSVSFFLIHPSYVRVRAQQRRERAVLSREFPKEGKKRVFEEQKTRFRWDKEEYLSLGRAVT